MNKELENFAKEIMKEWTPDGDDWKNMNTAWFRGYADGHENPESKPNWDSNKYPNSYVMYYRGRDHRVSADMAALMPVVDDLRIFAKSMTRLHLLFDPFAFHRRTKRSLDKLYSNKETAKFLEDSFKNIDETTRSKLEYLRSGLDEVFSNETKDSSAADLIKSSYGPSLSLGQAPAVALVVHSLFGGKIMHIVHECGADHWFNRIVAENGEFDVDLTGDQFCDDKVAIAEAGCLYYDHKDRIKTPEEMDDEAVNAAKILASKVEASLHDKVDKSTSNKS